MERSLGLVEERARRMRIAVFGSWKQHQRDKWGLQGSLGEFAETCRTLDEEIARRNHTMILGSVPRNTADVYAVEGAIRVARRQSLDWPINQNIIDHLEYQDINPESMRNFSQYIGELFRHDDRISKYYPNGIVISLDEKLWAS